MQVVGTGENGESSAGLIYADAAVGDTIVKVGYGVSEDVQANPDWSVNSDATAARTYHMSCAVGGLDAEDQIKSGCFDITMGLVVTVDGSAYALTPTAIVNKNGRTLQGFSTGAQNKMFDGCAGCPYFDYLHYYNYYGDHNYADKMVMAALDGTATGFTNSAGEMDFTGAGDAVRTQIIKKGTAYMNAYMYVIREFEDGIDDCNAGCIGDRHSADCNKYSLKAVHAWDEGVAFYTGSREGPVGSSVGKLMHNLADKRCENFKTCLGTDGVSDVSAVNDKLFLEFDVGKRYLQGGKCEETRPVVQKIVNQMAVPLIQGTLRYAYKVGKASGGEKEKAEGAIFAAAIVPRVAYCSAADAATIMNNMKYGAASTNVAAVKTAFENNYACMNVTCADVGGLWFSASNAYYDGMDPCEDLPPPSPPPPPPSPSPPPPPPPTSPTDADDDDSDTTTGGSAMGTSEAASTGTLATGAIAGIAIAAVLAGILLLVVIVMIAKEKQGMPIFAGIPSTTASMKTGGEQQMTTTKDNV
jgi:hypothetical protein